MPYNLLWIGSEIQLQLFASVFVFCKERNFSVKTKHKSAEIAQWRSECPWFNPGFRRHVHFLSSWNIFFIQAFTRTCWSRDQKKPTLLTHFYISILKNYSIFLDANDDTSYQHTFFFVPYGKVSLFNFDYLLSSFQFLTKKFNIGFLLYVTRCRTQNCTEIIWSEERMR